jgi:hypothetical protein
MTELLAAVILVHSFYASDCCGGKDCHPVPCSEIRQQQLGGWIWQFINFGPKALRVSEDGQCHVCVLPDFPPKGTCIYLPPGT